MKNVICVLGILLTGIIGSILMWYLGCCHCDIAEQPLKNTKNIVVEEPKLISIDKEHKELEDTYNRLTQNPFLLYFDFGSKQLIFNKEQSKKISEIANYISKKQSAYIEVTGYSDNIGDAIINKTVSLNRANFIKEQLLNSGIETSKIKVFGEGSSNPIATNSTIKGRALNRRVEIILKQN